MLERFNRLINCTWHIDFVGALACGFCLGAWTELVRDDKGFVLANFIWYVSLEVAAFAIAALVLARWSGRARCALGWLAVLALGSALSFFSVSAVGAINYGQRFMGDAWLSYVFERFVEWTLAGVVISLPVMVMVRALYIVIRYRRQRAIG
jgi:hypothetical protein